MAGNLVDSGLVAFIPAPAPSGPDEVDGLLARIEADVSGGGCLCRSLLEEAADMIRKLRDERDQAEYSGW